MNHKKNILVVGIGGGALKIIESLPMHNWSNVDLLCIDTDNSAIQNVPGKKILVSLEDTLPIGNNETLNSIFCKTCSQKEREIISECFKSKDIAIIVACLGGSTASVLSPMLARIARQRGALVISVVSLPDRWEPNKFTVALISFQKLRNNSDSIIPFPMPIYNYISKNYKCLEKFEKFHIPLMVSSLMSIFGIVTNQDLTLSKLRSFFVNNRIFSMGKGTTAYSAIAFPGICESRKHRLDILVIVSTYNKIVSFDYLEKVIHEIKNHADSDDHTVNVHLFVQFDKNIYTKDIIIFSSANDQDCYNSLLNIYKQTNSTVLHS